jgi:hypothetical protein
MRTGGSDGHPRGSDFSDQTGLMHMDRELERLKWPPTKYAKKALLAI